jgi:hypothetical protein
MFQRALQPATDQPAVEGVVAVLDEYGTLREAQKRPARVSELRRPDQHRPVDVMPLLGIRVDRRPAIDERVEEGERPRKLESLGSQLQDEERGIACRLDVDGDELGLVQRRLGAQLGRIDGDLLPRHRLRRTAGLQEDGFHDWRLRSAVRMNWISSRVIALRSTAAAA